MLYKTIFLLAVIHNWEIKHMNVNTAFFYGKINNEVYVEQPISFTKDN